jgi:hypothetical protein
MRATLVLWLCLITAAQGQEFAFEYWHEGRLVTDDSDTLKGSIQYDLQGDLLQLKRGELIETFTARKVIYFEIFDVTIKEYRVFFSLPYSTTGTYKAPVFFELLTEGKLTVLAREALEHKMYSSFYYYGTYTRLVLVNKYFILDERGNITAFVGTKNEWLSLMGTRGSEVQRYAKANRLDFDDKSELIKILTFYNSLFEKKG